MSFSADKVWLKAEQLTAFFFLNLLETHSGTGRAGKTLTSLNLTQNWIDTWT